MAFICSSSFSLQHLVSIPPLLLSSSAHFLFLSLRPLAFKYSTTIIPTRNPNLRNRTHFLRSLSLCRNAKDLRPFLSLLIVHNPSKRQSLAGALIRHCFRLGAPEIALSAFRTIEKPNIQLQNLIIRSLCDDGMFEDVLFIYGKCRILGCAPDCYTFPFVIKACSALSALDIGREVHCAVLRTGFGNNLVVQTALVDFYGKIGRTVTARMLLDRIPQPDLACWNALIAGYSLNGLDYEAFEVFSKIFSTDKKPNVSTLASTIPVCSRLGFIDTGRSLHGFSLKCGYFMDETLMPAFISMYASASDLSVARDVFDCPFKKNVIIWNAMISAYTRNQKSCEAFELFRKMLRDEMPPNAITFVSIIPSCENFGSIWYCESLHACAIKNGLSDQLSVVSSLVSIYAKHGYLNSSEFLFNAMPQKNLISWNSMVSAYVHNRYWGDSLATFRNMQLAGFYPDAISTISILTSCSELGAFLLGKSVHAFTLKTGTNLSMSVSNALLAFYSICGKLSSSFKLFHKMPVKNVISWNTMIAGCIQNGEITNASVLLDRMQQEAMNLDVFALISILPCYNGSDHLVHGMAIHCYALKAGFSSDDSLANALISMYFNCGDLNSGKLIFEHMPNKSVVSWNAILTGYRYQGVNSEVMTLFGKMMRENEMPNHVTLLSILPVCTSHLQGKSVHAYMAKTQIMLEIPVLTSLITMYARFGNADSCTLLFQMGEKREIGLWNAIMSAYVQLESAKLAISFFCKLLRTEKEPDYITILSLISACVQLNNLSLANTIMAFLIKKGFERDVGISNALIDLYARCGNISLARKLFEGIFQKDAVSWSVMINGYGLYGDGEAALALFSQMRILGLKPDNTTYLSILSACSHAGLVKEGTMVFNSMVGNGILPQKEHYSCLVDLLGRNGYLEEAYDIVTGLPNKFSINQLQSLLGACLIDGRIDLGEQLGKLLLEMNTKNSGPYVLLYNLYATAGRWTDANRVRSDMESKQLMKVPGYSLVEGINCHFDF